MGDFNMLLVMIMVLLTLFLVLLERKLLAYSQRRLGPVLFGRNGLFQILFDLVKLMTKEIFLIPSPSSFIMPIFVCMFFAMQLFFSQTFIFGVLLFNILNLESQILFHLIMIMWSNIFFSIIGLFSISSYAMIGTISSLVHMISLDIFITIMYSFLVLMSQSTNFMDFVSMQYTYIYFIMYLQISFSFMIILLLESKRTPFDHSETESEVVSGYSTEYSGSMLMILYLTEYMHIFIASMHFILFFFGGWIYLYLYVFLPSIFMLPNLSIFDFLIL